MCRTAPVAILVCGETSLEKFPGYWVQDCSAATQNILLAAHALGYGAVWVGIHPRAERIAAIRELLRLPEGIHPLCLVPVGRPAGPLAPADRYQPSRVRRDRWE
jgi:nitroreductase